MEVHENELIPYLVTHSYVDACDVVIMIGGTDAHIYHLNNISHVNLFDILNIFNDYLYLFRNGSVDVTMVAFSYTY